VISRIQVGQPVRITVDAAGVQPLEGKVEQILPEADTSSRTVAVKVLVSNQNRAILPGFFARATFFSSSDEQAMQVPKDAVVYRGESASVVALRDGKAAVIPVQVLALAGDMASVQSPDLKPDDQVVTHGNEQLRGGEMLMVRGAPPTTKPM
jgi:Cu(I)/Ag(I) efflux system membrane fusion protein